MERSELARLIGNITIIWNDVHSYFFLAFLDCSGLDTDMARAIYFSNPSDKAQRSLALVAVTELAGKDSSHSKEFTRIVRSADAVATKRNAAVHQLWEVEERDSMVMRPNRSLHLHRAFEGGHVDVLRGLDSEIGRIYVDLLDWNEASFQDLNAAFKARFGHENVAPHLSPDAPAG